jgi:hypothetical protein
MPFILDFSDVSGGSPGPQDVVTSELISLVPESWTEGRAKQRGGNFWLIISMIAQTIGWAREAVINSRKQLRLMTATGNYLDRFGRDYFGSEPGIRLPRKSGEADNTYRHRVMAEILREKVTIQGVIQSVQELTGGSVGVFEPFDAVTAAAWHGPFGSGSFEHKYHPYPSYVYGNSQIHAFQNADGTVANNGLANYATVGGGNVGVGGPGSLGLIYTFYVQVHTNPNSAKKEDIEFLVNRIKPLGTKAIVEGAF